MRRLRPLRGGLPGRRDLPRSGRERRQRGRRAALREGLPDPQDALHLLRLLRRGVPGVGDLHGQGLRARRLQQQGLHLGQAGSAGPGAGRRRVGGGPAGGVRDGVRERVTGFLDALDARVLICDGAMGTMLYGKGVFLNRSFDELNLTQPDLVAEIHQAYVRAGADVLETNTFGANRLKLGPFGLGERLQEINAAGVRIARQAARGQAYVAGAIGPLGVRVEPWGKTGLDEAEAAFREQAQALADAGVDLFMLETFGDVAELGAAVRGVRAVSDKPVVAQLTTGDDGVTADGTPPEQFTAELEALGADVIGLNCSVGPAAMLETIERIAERTTARLSVQPNAGRPRDVEGRNIYLSSPEYMASYARRFAQQGVRLVGGCCGTTPEHIRQMKAAIKQVNVGKAKDAGSTKTRPTPQEPDVVGRVLS